LDDYRIGIPAVIADQGQLTLCQVLICDDWIDAADAEVEDNALVGIEGGYEVGNKPYLSLLTLVGRGSHEGKNPFDPCPNV
jgi:hypothetical protein